MKLATLLLGILLAGTGTAAADEVLHPPGGHVPVSDAPPMRGERGDRADRAERVDRGDRGARAERVDRGGRGDRGRRGPHARKLRRALVETFDANGDGRLGPRERMRAVRALRRVERRLATGAGTPDARGPDARGRAVRGALRRYDRDRDGNIGPGELPPAAARKLRRLDRDRDGWVEPGEYR